MRALSALIDMVGSALTSSFTQTGGQEGAVLSLHPMQLHQGVVFAGVSCPALGQSQLDEIADRSPYGAATLAGADGSRGSARANELELATFQSCHEETAMSRLALRRIVIAG